MIRRVVKIRFVKYLIIFVFVTIGIFLLLWYGIYQKYQKAVELYENYQFEEAKMYFDELGKYKKSEYYKAKIERNILEKDNPSLIINEDKDKEEKDREEVIEDNILVLASSEITFGMINTIISCDEPVDYEYDVDDIVAYDQEGNDYTAEQLANRRVILYYIDNKSDVFFAGQFNENGQWNGNCIINVYNNNCLINATEANYEEGIMINYNQLLVESDCCIYSERECDNNQNYGDTWKYRSIGSINQKINIDSPDEDDLIRPNEVKANFSTSLISRYHGITKDGYYEDDTGDSFYIAYYEDGKIRTLYYGGFHKGKFDDNSGNAWYITCSRENKANYMYYIGEFSMGEPSNASLGVETDLSIQRIQEIVNNFSIDIILNWDYDYVSE